MKRDKLVLAVHFRDGRVSTYLVDDEIQDGQPEWNLFSSNSTNADLHFTGKLIHIDASERSAGIMIPSTAYYMASYGLYSTEEVIALREQELKIQNAPKFSGSVIPQ